MPGSSDGATSKELESSRKIPGKVLMAGKVRVSSQPEEEDDCPICLEGKIYSKLISFIW